MVDLQASTRVFPFTQGAEGFQSPQELCVGLPREGLRFPSLAHRWGTALSTLV